LNFAHIGHGKREVSEFEIPTMVQCCSSFSNAQVVDSRLPIELLRRNLKFALLLIRNDHQQLIAATRARRMRALVSVVVLVQLLSGVDCFVQLSAKRMARVLYSYPDDDAPLASIARTPFSRSGFLATLVAIPVIALVATNVEEPLAKQDGTAQAASTLEQQFSKQQQQASASTAREESISSFVAGAALTVTKTLAKYPLDTATVRLQMPDSAYSILNPVQLLQGCYTGLPIPLITNIPGGAVFYSVKDAVKASLLDTGLSEWSRTCIGVAAAQIPYWIVRNPSEVVRTRQQVGIPGYTESVSTIEAFKRVRDDRIRESNATGFTAGLDAYYSGYWENIYYSFPADVMKFVFYEQLTQNRKSRVDEALAGAAATAISQLLTTPLDVVRNRVMAEKAGGADTSYVGILVQIARDEGLKGLFAGATPNVLKALISGAIQFATYEETKQEITKLFFRKA
jgi:solute carrier family 25 (mitochondrial S-adenosylmethionine transporter), member 26